MTQRSILITGCSSGIGLDAARTLSARGWQVFASCRKPEDVERLITEGLTCVQLDHTDEQSMTAALAEVLQQTGGTLDALFNNGAIAIPGAVEDLPTDALRQIFETNLFGYHALTRQVIPVMRRQGHGRILNCSSVLGFTALKWRGAYNATKFALEGLSDTLRLELRDTNIEVVLIQPGPITTRIRQNAIPQFERWIDWRSSALATKYEKTLMKRLYADRGPDRFELPPAAVTAKVITALEAANPRARYRVTTPTHLMHWAKRLLPQRAFDWISDKG